MPSPSIVGTAVGVPLSRVPLTAVPQRTALSHAFGGLAAGLVGTAKYMLWLQDGQLTAFRTTAIAIEVILGYLTFTGSLMAAGKLQEIIPTRPITYRGQNLVNLVLLAIAVVASGVLIVHPEMWGLFPVVIVLSLVFGVLLIVPDRRRGHADRHLAAELVRRPLGGGDGLRPREQGAHHRGRARRVVGPHPVGHHVPGDEPIVHQRAVRGVRAGPDRRHHQRKPGPSRAARPRTPRICSAMPSSVVIVPGYGMAVSQAQHRVREIYDALTKQGIDVKFAIHPVAGRMPGHMNVLLAEAEVPYEALIEMDDINRDLPQTDVVLVIGANDVVNPAARHDTKSPIYGMPIIDADKAKFVIANKRSMNPGFAGIDNELYYADNTLMLFGDAKTALGEVVKALTGGGGH